MKKRILAGFLLAFMLMLSALPCFAEAVEAVPAEEAPAEEIQVEEVPTRAVEPAPLELPVGNSFTVNEAAYDNEAQKITLKITNSSTENEAILFVRLVYDSALLNVTPDNQSIFPGEMAAQLGLETKDGIIINVSKEVKAGAEQVIVIPAAVPGYDEKAANKNLPLVSADIISQSLATEMDLTMSAALDSKLAIQEITDLFGVESISGGQAVSNFLKQTGFAMLINGFQNNWKVIVMLLISFVLLYLAIVKKFEPLLLLPIAFGMLLTNLPGAEMFHESLFAGGHVHWDMFGGAGGVTPGLLDYLYLGVKLGIYPCLIFVGVGAMTDFGPLIANPKSLLLGAAAQLGIFITYIAMSVFFGFTPAEASSTGIIGGADGPTAIFVTSRLAPHLLGPIAVAAYSYMALVPVIQPPIMKVLTTKKERQIVMKPLREVSKTEKIVFPIAVTVFVSLLVPSAGPLVGALMLGNLARECGVVDRIAKTVQNELMNIVTIFLGLSVGATATANTFLAPKTLAILCMGIVAFGCGTAGGVLLAKFMNLFTKNKINPLIGSAGVSAVPMAARVSQVVGQKENPQNFLLMHAMGPNVAGVIGSAIAAGVLIALFG